MSDKTNDITEEELEAVVGGGFFKKLQEAGSKAHALYGKLTPEQQAAFKAKALAAVTGTKK